MSHTPAQVRKIAQLEKAVERSQDRLSMAEGRRRMTGKRIQSMPEVRAHGAVRTARTALAAYLTEIA